MGKTDQKNENRFSFEADGSSTYRIELLGLPADYDVELYDSDAKKIAAPNRRGKATEKIREKLSAGRYYVRVVGYEGALHPGARRGPQRRPCRTAG